MTWLIQVEYSVLPFQEHDFILWFYSQHRRAGTYGPGHLVVRDDNIIMHNRKHSLPPEGQESDAAACMQGTLIVANVNFIIADAALQRGFVVEYALLTSGSTRPLGQ
jgi:hypothetical protein